MADPRLSSIANAAIARGWEIEWQDSDHRTELLVIPTISNPEQQGFLGMGFGVTLGGEEIAMCCWESWACTLIEPLPESEIPGDPTSREPCIDDENLLFQRVTTLEEALPIFDEAVRRYLAAMRRTVLESGGVEGLFTWADPEPIAGTSR
jgi:hypothetical protein